jgi:hypothetical protein
MGTCSILSNEQNITSSSENWYAVLHYVASRASCNQSVSPARNKDFFPDIQGSPSLERSKENHRTSLVPRLPIHLRRNVTRRAAVRFCLREGLPA